MLRYPTLNHTLAEIITIIIIKKNTKCKHEWLLLLHHQWMCVVYAAAACLKRLVYRYIDIDT